PNASWISSRSERGPNWSPTAEPGRGGKRAPSFGVQRSKGGWGGTQRGQLLSLAQGRVCAERRSLGVLRLGLVGAHSGAAIYPQSAVQPRLACGGGRRVPRTL